MVLPAAVHLAFEKVVSLPGVSIVWMAGAKFLRLVAEVVAGGARTLNPFEGAGDALRLQPVKVSERGSECRFCFRLVIGGLSGGGHEGYSGRYLAWSMFCFGAARASGRDMMWRCCVSYRVPGTR